MTPNKLIFIVLLAIFATFSAPAHALDCAPAPISESSIESSDVIFEGRITASRKLGLMEGAKLKLTGLEQKGGGISDLLVYEFAVSRGWKGTQKGETVQILRNTYWGDNLKDDIDYLVFANAQGDFYEAGICGLSRPLAHAKIEKNFLFDHIGLGKDIKVMGDDAKCKKDIDCTAIITDCGGCSCGTPVSVSAHEKYRALKRKTCDTDEPREMCEMECPAQIIRCIDNRCALQEPNR